MDGYARTYRLQPSPKAFSISSPTALVLGGRVTKLVHGSGCSALSAFRRHGRLCSTTSAHSRARSRALKFTDAFRLVGGTTLGRRAACAGDDDRGAEGQRFREE